MKSMLRAVEVFIVTLVSLFLIVSVMPSQALAGEVESSPMYLAQGGSGGGGGGSGSGAPAP